VERNPAKATFCGAFAKLHFLMGFGAAYERRWFHPCHLLCSKGLLMCDSNDNWPMPDYSVGPTKHLHAVGVITTLYNSFESSVCVFFRHHLDLLKVPQKVTEFMFHELNEQKRLEALRLVFTNCEKDPDTLAVILNLLEYFQWCWDARNKLAHAEHYPKSFGRLTDELNLTKQISKRNPTRGYIRVVSRQGGPPTCLNLFAALHINFVAAKNISVDSDCCAKQGALNF
jgi:hypothetical protein